jgi:hypothetical protein
MNQLPATERSTNPLLQGFALADTVPPDVMVRRAFWKKVHADCSVHEVRFPSHQYNWRGGALSA